MLPVLLIAGGFGEGDAQRDPFAGGLHWQAAGTSLVEGALAATLPLFLIGWSREHWAGQGPLLRELARTAYGAFIIHPPLIVGLALALDQAPIPAEVKFAVVLAGGVAASFGLTALVIRVPVVAAVVGSGPRAPKARPPEPLAARGG